jgi:hypothetical protein
LGREDGAVYGADAPPVVYLEIHQKTKNNMKIRRGYTTMTSKAQVLRIEGGQRSDTPLLSDDEVHTLSRAQAAEYLRERWGLAYARRTLVIYAARGTGPVYARIGARAVYTRQALDEWAKSRVTAPGRKASDLKSIRETENDSA